MPIHLPSASHWILVIIVPRCCEIMLIDSYPNKRHYEISQILFQWLRDTHDALNRPFFPALWTIISSDALPADRPVQNDSNSCGVLVALAAAYWMWYHRLPTSEDFTQQTISQAAFLHAVCSLSWTHNKHSWLRFWTLTYLCNRPFMFELVVWFYLLSGNG